MHDKTYADRTPPNAIDIAHAPFRSSLLTVDPKWIDHNGHLNQSYYSWLFDLGLMEIFSAIGLGPPYIKARNCSTMTVESHLCFIREVFAGNQVRVSAQFIDVDDKRLHMYCELHHEAGGWLSCTSEWMELHIDMATRKTAPWPADIRATLDQMKRSSDLLPRPQRAGRSIGIPRRG